MLYGRQFEDTGVCEWCECTLGVEDHDEGCPAIAHERMRDQEDEWRVDRD